MAYHNDSRSFYTPESMSTEPLPSRKGRERTVDVPLPLSLDL